MFLSNKFAISVSWPLFPVFELNTEIYKRIYEYSNQFEYRETTDQKKICYGVSETVFKLTYANHEKIFNNIKYQNDTELSSKYWNIISANKTSNIS